jgi:hypothetical protein
MVCISSFIVGTTEVIDPWWVFTVSGDKGSRFHLNDVSYGLVVIIDHCKMAVSSKEWVTSLDGPGNCMPALGVSQEL